MHYETQTQNLFQDKNSNLLQNTWYQKWQGEIEKVTKHSQQLHCSHLTGLDSLDTVCSYETVYVTLFTPDRAWQFGHCMFVWNSVLS